MSPKKSSTRKTAPRKPAAKPKVESPMRKIEHAVGPNEDGLAHQARSAHELEPPAQSRATSKTASSGPPPMNTPPQPQSPATKAVDEGQEK